MKIYIGNTHPTVYKVIEVEHIDNRQFAIETPKGRLYIDLPVSSDKTPQDIINTLYDKGKVFIETAEVNTKMIPRDSWGNLIIGG